MAQPELIPSESPTLNRRAEALSREFAAALHRGVVMPVSAGALVGIEHEFRVLRHGRQIDFGSLLGQLDLGRKHLDPGDANARRLPSGAVLTCDGREAEIALPPIAVETGFALAAVTAAAVERSGLQLLLGDECSLEGYSTHISVSIDAGLAAIDQVARHYACTFAPALMLLLDRRHAYGIYIRPRPGRLELCGEFAAGARLEAALMFAAGSVRASVSAVLDPSSAQRVPPRLRVELTPAGDRHGYLVHREAFGNDLYQQGRTAPLRAASGAVLSAQKHLALSWECARAALGNNVADSDMTSLAHVIDGDMPLPASDGDDAAAAPGAAQTAGASTAYAWFSRPIARPGFEMAAVMLTWDAAVLVAKRSSRRRTAFVCIPRPAMEPFFDQLDDGVLDSVIESFLRKRWRRAHLHDRMQLTKPGLFGTIGRRRALLAREP